MDESSWNRFAHVCGDASDLKCYTIMILIIQYDMENGPDGLSRSEKYLIEGKHREQGSGLLLHI